MTRIHLEELDLENVHISDEEAQAFEDFIDTVSKAISDAGIPRTLDWAMLLVQWAAQTCVVQGLACDVFLELVNNALARTKEGVGSPDAVGLDLTNLDVHARGMRLVNALRAANIHTTRVETLGALLALAVDVFEDASISFAFVRETATAMFNEGDARLEQLAKRKGSA